MGIKTDIKNVYKFGKCSQEMQGIETVNPDFFIFPQISMNWTAILTTLYFVLN